MRVIIPASVLQSIVETLLTPCPPILLRGGTMGSKILFTPVAEPDPEHLWNLFFLFRGQTTVECQSSIALSPTGSIVMGIPIAAGDPNPPTNFFD
jgi:hypothetical protein